MRPTVAPAGRKAIARRPVKKRRQPGVQRRHEHRYKAPALSSTAKHRRRATSCIDHLVQGIDDGRQHYHASEKAAPSAVALYLLYGIVRRQAWI